MTAVLDTSAVLASLWGEPGSERVDAVMNTGVISSVNHAELIAKLVDRGANAGQIADVLAALNLDVADFDVGQAGVSGELRRSTRASGLSLGDRCCLSLAMQEGWPALTADRTWGDLQVEVEIEVIR